MRWQQFCLLPPFKTILTCIGGFMNLSYVKIFMEDLRRKEHKEEAVKKTCGQDRSSDSIKKYDSGSRPDDKKIPRNQLCPCGSKTKYKACCGSVTWRSSTKLIVYTTELYFAFGSIYAI
ncbi:hypothetical protein REPUB_Repub09cG0161300 [Reevesia pubescens]